MAETRLPPLVEPKPAPAAIRVRVLFFASLADLMGERQRDLALPRNATLADTVGCLARDVPELAARAPHVSFARNEEFVPVDTRLADGDELALIPPVSGG